MHTNQKITKKDIINYYNNCEIDYKLIWKLDKAMAMHFGYWHKGTWTLRRALDNENRLLADLANIQKSDNVLDAGCGVGGSAVYLAHNYDCNVTGITISDQQVRKANENANKYGLENKLDFRVMDFTNTLFDPKNFDVVWAIESVCHADDKSDFIEEAHRLLKDEGRLVVADGFMSNEHLNEEDMQLMASWLNGWGVNSLDTSREFYKLLESAGFKNIEYKNITREIEPSSRRLYYYSQVTQTLGSVAEKVKLRTEEQTGNILAAQNQYKALKRELWEYGIFTATK